MLLISEIKRGKKFLMSEDYEIPVYFKITGLTKGFIEGTIRKEKRYLPYLEANIYNSYDLVEEQNIENTEFIYCHQKSGGERLLLVGINLSNFRSSSGYRQSYRIYFDFLISSPKEYKSSSELQFSKLLLSFENLYKWLIPNDNQTRDNNTLFEVNLNNFNNKRIKFKLKKYYNFLNDKKSDLRIRSEEHDVKVELTFIGCKIYIHEVNDFISNLESFLTCLSGQSSFCIDATLMNKSGNTRFWDFHKVFISSRISEPSFELEHSIYTCNPFILNHPDELKTALKNYAEHNNLLNNIMEKISSVLLFNKRFLYDLEFHFISTLIETCHRLEFTDEKPIIDPKRIEKSLSTEINDTKILSDVMKAIEFALKKSFGSKIRDIEAFQYRDSHIIKFNSSEIYFIKENRNKISHGDSMIRDDKISTQEILEKMKILILYYIWKKLGLSSELIKTNVIRSFYLQNYPLNKDAIEFEMYDKIYLSHKDYNKVKVLPVHVSLIIEQVEDDFYFNARYTKFFEKDSHRIRYYSRLSDYLNCYYINKKIENVGYKSSVFIVNKNSPKDRKLFYSYNLIKIKQKNRVDAYKINDTLIPMEVYKSSSSKGSTLLKEYRNYNGYTIKELSKKAGISESTIRLYEKSSKIANKETYRKILLHLGTNLIRNN